MKFRLHDIQIWLVLVLIMAGMQSCTDEVEEAAQVEVGFTATLPTDALSRSFGHAEQVNTLVVGVFDEQYQEIDRMAYPMTGTSTNVSMTLAQSQTYHFVFWAYHYDPSQELKFYDLRNLTAIRMNPISESITLNQAEAMDAFFAVQEHVTLVRDKNYPIEMVRPLAQINVGTSGTPMQASFTAKSAPDTFYPFTNEVSGTTTNFTWQFSETTAEQFPAGGKDYTYLAMGYVFAPVTATTIAAELTLIEAGKSVTLDFPQVEIAANKRSNIAGRFSKEK